MTVLEQLVRLPAWRRYAACRGRTELFYGSELEQRIAVAVCAGCGVREDCLAECLAEELLLGPLSVYGVRGGLTAEQRRRRQAVEPGSESAGAGLTRFGGDHFVTIPGNPVTTA